MENNKELNKGHRIEKGSVEPMLAVSISVHGMPCIEMENVDPEIRSIIRSVLLENRMDQEAYKLRTKAGAFLQGDTSDWILIEFFQKDFQPFVDYLNERIAMHKIQKRE